jgi:transcriptional regulator with XRE-family HTH domain
LTPAEIQAIRERLGPTQERFAQLTGIGTATLFRWERGRLLQNRAMDCYLRLIASGKENVRFLEKLQGPEPSPGPPPADLRSVLQGPNQDVALGTAALPCPEAEQPATDLKVRRSGAAPRCREYTRDELVQALREHGPRLLARFFQPCPDLEDLIRRSVAGYTFRSFRGLSRPPSELFREWAASRLSFSVMAELGEIRNQADYDQFLTDHAMDLTRRWKAKGKKPLPFGPGRKLLDLLFKGVVRYAKIPDADRQRLIRFLHVPLDSFSLVAVRQCAASDEFGPPIKVPPKATMGFVTSKQYPGLQQLMRGIAAVAGVPPICIDLVAWDQAHVM